MLKALIFDCDGVIADTEPMHLAAFQRVLSEEGIDLSAREYYAEYLANDDVGAFQKILSAHSRAARPELISELIQRKSRYLEPVMRDNLRIFPGVVPFVTAAAEFWPLAVASGALRHEVALVLKHAGIANRFVSIVAAEDVTHGKPDPAAFMTALSRINITRGAGIRPEETLVIEDSIHGVNAALAAGMLCLAVTNSYPKEKLANAHLIVDSLERLDVRQLQRMLVLSE